MEQKIYLPHQLKALLPSDAYKVLDTLMSFQKEGIISYSKRNADFLHLDSAITDQVIQTAIDRKIIAPVEQSGGVYRFKILTETIEKAKEIQMTDIPKYPLIELSEEITFKNEMGKKEKSAEQLIAEIAELKRQLMSKMNNPVPNDLPF